MPRFISGIIFMEFKEIPVFEFKIFNVGEKI
jgi:hypothetical protein